MPNTSDVRIPSFTAPVADPQVGDIYFEAVSISSEPIGRGSDEEFEVANNPITGGGDPSPNVGAFTLVRFVSNGNARVYVAPGSVNSEFASGTGESSSYLLGSSTREFYVKCNLDSATQAVTSCSITTSQPNDSLTVAGYGIGSASEDLITQGNTGSLSLISCGTNHYFS